MSVANCTTPVAIGPSVPSILFFFFMMEGGTFLGTELRATSMLVGSKGHTGGKMKEGNNKY